MSEMNQNLPPTLRSALDEFYTSPQPDSAFAERLEAQLHQRQIELIRMAPVAASPKQNPGSSHLTHRRSFMHMLRTRPILAVIAAILALLLLSGIAYAIYRVASDPGLQSVQDAGLVKNIGVTAKPTILPTSTAGPTRSAASIGTAQTVEGVTLTLDWVYLDEGHLALGWTNTQLTEGLSLDSPAVTFKNASPLQTQGWSYHTDGTKAQYISYQVIHAKEIGGKADLSVDIPLVSNSDTQKAVGSFHYELKDIPVNIGQFISLQQTYAVRYNGVEVRLKSARVLPNAVKLSVCFGDVAEAAPNWNVQSAPFK